MSARSVTLTVAGQTLSLRTDQSDEALLAITDTVNRTVSRIQGASRAVPTNKVYLLAALTMAEELFRARRQYDELRELVHQSAREAIQVLDGQSSPG